MSLAESRIIVKREGPQMSSNDVFGVLLGELWEAVVKPIFAVLNLEKSQTPPRVWWCLTGEFTFLPIHAAGIYGPDSTDCVSDYVISSYTPTLTALLDPPLSSGTPFKMTTLVQPESNGMNDLPGTRDELDAINKHVPDAWHTRLGLDSEVTVNESLLHLEQSSIVHFACHGTQDLTNPLDSGLFLTDGLLKISDIMRGTESGGKPAPGSQKLGFLSACETATGDTRSPDEAMHIAASLLFAGFTGVVGTMWKMQDSDGPNIVEAFYEHLFRNSDLNANPPLKPDLTGAAEALHIAVLKLRKTNVPFKRWVPFVHYGI
ncbi:CHAT domain-containing protein [Mycena epipterygia]|nr:CHAT domain-containing protein [Mycena epipterygia]